MSATEKNGNDPGRLKLARLAAERSMPMPPGGGGQPHPNPSPFMGKGFFLLDVARGDAGQYSLSKNTPNPDDPLELNDPRALISSVISRSITTRDSPAEDCSTLT